MTGYELIFRLQELIETHGDQEVILPNEDAIDSVEYNDTDGTPAFVLVI